MNWFSMLRPLAHLSREVRRLREQVTRLADAAERIAPPRPELSEAPEPPVALANTPTDFGRLYALEGALTRQLGREPDESELMRAYDGDPEIRRRKES